MHSKFIKWLLNDKICKDFPPFDPCWMCFMLFDKKSLYEFREIERVHKKSYIWLSISHVICFFFVGMVIEIYWSFLEKKNITKFFLKWEKCFGNYSFKIRLLLMKVLLFMKNCGKFWIVDMNYWYGMMSGLIKGCIVVTISLLNSIGLIKSITNSKSNVRALISVRYTKDTIDIDLKIQHLLSNL